MKILLTGKLIEDKIQRQIIGLVEILNHKIKKSLNKEHLLIGIIIFFKKKNL